MRYIYGFGKTQHKRKTTNKNSISVTKREYKNKFCTIWYYIKASLYWFNDDE